MKTQLFRIEHRQKRILIEGVVGDHISKYFDAGYFYERDLLEVVSQLHLRGPYVDLGAHVGNHSVFFLRFCPCTCLVAVEADSELAAICARNVANNLPLFGRARVTDAPHTRASVLCEIVGDPKQTYAYSRGPDHNLGMGSAAPTSGGRPGLSMEQLCEKAGIEDLPVLVKMDLEGAEAPILAASEGWLRRARPVVITEAATHDALEKVAAVLEPLNYRRQGPYCKTPTYLWRIAAASADSAR